MRWVLGHLPVSRLVRAGTQAGAVVYVLPETRTPYQQFSRDAGGDAKSPA